MFMEANIILNYEIWNLYLYDQEQQKGITPTTPIPHVLEVIRQEHGTKESGKKNKRSYLERKK